MASPLNQDDNIPKHICNDIEKCTNENTKHECPSTVPENYNISKHESADTDQDKARDTNKGSAEKLGVSESPKPLTPCKNVKQRRDMPNTATKNRHEKVNYKESMQNQIQKRTEKKFPLGTLKKNMSEVQGICHIQHYIQVISIKGAIYIKILNGLNRELIQNLAIF